VIGGLVHLINYWLNINFYFNFYVFSTLLKYLKLCHIDDFDLFRISYIKCKTIIFYISETSSSKKISETDFVSCINYFYY